MSSKRLTTREAADRLGTTTAQVLTLIRTGHLAAEKFGWVWMIPEAALDGLKLRSVGRPPAHPCKPGGEESR